MQLDIIAQNFDFLMMSIDSLYLSSIEKFYQYEKLSSIKLHKLRMSNPFRKLTTSSNLDSEEIFRSSKALCLFIQEKHTQILLIELLEIYISSKGSNQSRQHLLKYQKRFEFFFKKFIDPNKIGKLLYYDQQFIYQLSIFNLYILYLISSKQGFYYVTYYLNHISFLRLYKSR